MTADEIKRSVDITEYIRSCGVELKKHGSKDLAGLCLFHADKNPSLIVSPSKGVFHCMGCGAKGSVIDFAMKFHKIDFKEALKRLGGSNGGNGVTAKKEKPPSAPARELPPGRAVELLEKTISFSEKAHANSGAGRKYLESRGISDAGILARHRAGLADGSLLKALPSAGPIVDDLKTLGVLLEDGRERFHGCAVFPVLDADGQIVTIYGRSIEGRKHVYLPERPTGLFNAAVMKLCPEIILVESVIDALSLEMADVRNAVAIMSVNGLSDDDVKVFKIHGVRRIVLMMDGDEPGRTAAHKLMGRLAADFAVATIPLPGGHDPNSFLVANGAEALADLVSSSLAAGIGDPLLRKGASPAASAPGDAASQKSFGRGAGGEPSAKGFTRNGFSVVYGLRRYEVIGLEKSARGLKATVRVEKSGKLHVDTLDFNSARHRRQLCQDLCLVFEEVPETIEGDIAKLLRLCEERAADPRADGADAPAEPAAPPVSESERLEAEAFGKSADLITKIMADYERCGLVGEESNKLLCYLAMTSRKMAEPLSVMILSSSGAGKTALQDAALAFCPPEDLVKLTSLSARALFYKERTSLKHKVLAIEEGAGAEEASYAIRNLISADALTSETATRDPVTGRLTTMANTVEGPTAVFVTNTNPEVDAETRSRFLVTGIDESREQTRRILESQRARRASPAAGGGAEREAILKRHRNFQRLLRPLAVVNPLASTIEYSDDRLQCRRAQPQYLGIIDAVAFLRQMAKEARTREGEAGKVEHVEVDEEDMKAGHALAAVILGRTLDELSIPARSLLELIEALVDGRLAELAKSDRERLMRRSGVAFTRRDLRDYSGWTRTRLQTHLKELIDMEHVVIDSGKFNSLQTYKLAYDGQGKDGSRFIPGVKSAGSGA